ncbi:hypothetical protein EMCRGX_G021847 [Ephydatia muelleri]
MLNKYTSLSDAFESYDTLALASLRANMTVIGLMAAPKIHLKSVRSMQRNTPGLLDRRIGPKDMFIVLLYMYITVHARTIDAFVNTCIGYTSGVLAVTLLSGYHYTPWGVIPKQAYEHP